MRIAKMQMHSSGNWRVRINGKCYYLGKDKDGAERQYRGLLVEHYGAMGVGAIAGVGGSLTVSDLLTAYIADRLKTCPAEWLRTRTDIYTQVSRHVVVLYGNLPVDALLHNNINGFRVLLGYRARKKLVNQIWKRHGRNRLVFFSSQNVPRIHDCLKPRNKRRTDANRSGCVFLWSSHLGDCSVHKKALNVNRYTHYR